MYDKDQEYIIVEEENGKLNIRLQIPDSQLVIKRVEYYFHHYVMSLDYMAHRIYLPEKQWKKHLEDLKESSERFDEYKLNELIRHRSFPTKERDILFSIALSSQNALDSGEITKGLRQEFQKRGILLPHSSWIEKGNARWWIADPRKEENPLFNIALSFRSDLDSDKISDELEEEFENKGFQLNELRQ